MERTIVDLKLRVVEELSGRLNLAQDYAERKEAVCEVFLGLGGNPEDKALIKKAGFNLDRQSAEGFADGFLSYDAVAEFLVSADVEDIIIDGLKSIFLHSTKSGFVKTEKKVSHEQGTGFVYQEADCPFRKRPCPRYPRDYESGTAG